ncbi:MULTISPECIES: YihY/virulence factor BrkB family protein [unclassified Streptomyces]|uniref:YihY/virulence factor BrkB family protein n=1 Tax=unclassified Streptomyces TaxID=2593676 RepID=UPI002E17D30C|nr:MULTISPECIES: YihY/virulence factor BrkB family protein [unclassified Streptomyces]
MSADPHALDGTPHERGPRPVPSRGDGSVRTWRAALRRTPVSMWRDDMSDSAAALTYYAILTVLPSLLVISLAFSLISPKTAEEFIAHVSEYAPGQSGTQLHDVLSRALHHGTAAWMLLAAGAVSALWSASSYLAVFRRAVHRMHRVADRRSTWHKAHRILITALALLGILVLSALVLLMTGPLAETLGRYLGLGTAAALAWSLLRWPLLLCVVALLVVIVFRTGPAQARVRTHSIPGGALAAFLWLCASAGFAFYTSELSAYSRLYGSLAGAVVFLIWLWLSNLALLAGAQFTAELSELETRTSD